MANTAKLRRSPSGLAAKNANQSVTCPLCGAVMTAERYPPHAIDDCPGTKQERIQERSVQQRQRDAAAQGKRWVKCPCTDCGTEVPVHVQWERPLVMCGGCRTKRRHRLDAVQDRINTRKALSGPTTRMPTKGWGLSGGLPTLGKRR